MKQFIGRAEIQYEEGAIKSSSFTTEIDNVDLQEIHQEQLSHKNEEGAIKSSADNILASIFSKLTEIELRDIDSTDIIHKITCEKNGKEEVVKCVIEYYLVSK